MRRILHVSATEKLGGAERSLVELTGALDRSRFESHAVLPGKGTLADALRERGVAVQFAPIERIRRTVNPLRIAEYIAAISRASRRIADIARAERIDLVHANNDVAQVYAGEAAARAGLPCVWHARDMLSLGPLGARLSERASRVLAVSDAVRDHLAGCGVDASKIRVVRNGVDLGAFEGTDLAGARASARHLGAPAEVRTRARRELGLAGDAFVVGTAGAFVPWKKHEDFVRAFGRLAGMEMTDLADGPDGPGSEGVDIREMVPARGVVFGADLLGDHGRYEYDLKCLADELAGERILFPGWREGIAGLLPALDVFVSASEGEPFGRVIVEAMAAGLPVVATDSGGKREIVEDGKTGVLVPQGDADAMAKALDGLRRDRDRRATLGLAARRAAFEKFNVERVAREVEAVYEEVLGGEG
jgi:glycosyltransferase involved in cell wall biosynthesis